MIPPAPRAGVTLLSLTVALVTAAIGCDRAPRARTVEVWLGGDVHLGGKLADPEAVAARLAPLAAHTRGVGIVNLEGAAGDTLDAPPDRLFNHPFSIRGLARAGVLVAGIANNHARDGDPGATAEAVRAADLIPAGLAAGPAVVIRDGVRLVIAAHAVDETPADELRTSLAASRRRGDVLIVSLHVVATPSYLPGPATIAAVEAAVSAGAAVVVVHGSHAVARVERRGRAVIAWGLGNLLFTCACTDEVDALLLRVTLGRDGVREARVVPIAAGVGGRPAAPSREAALIFDLLASLASSPLERAGDHARF